MKNKIIVASNDLYEIINDPIYFSVSGLDIAEETDDNMWGIELSDDITKNNKLLVVISDCIKNVIANRLHQVRTKYSGKRAQFYLWFDEQAGQLRFNIISGNNLKLPFGSQVRTLQEPTEILENFIESNTYIPYDEVEFNAIDDEDGDDFDEEKYILDVFVYSLK